MAGHSSNQFYRPPEPPPIAYTVRVSDGGRQVTLYLSEGFARELLADLRQVPRTRPIERLGRTLVQALRAAGSTGG